MKENEVNPTPEDEFVAFLESLLEQDDRAALAALRRGLGKEPGTVIEMHKVLMWRLPRAVSRRREDDYFTVAALFGLHPKESWRPSENRRHTNLGASLGTLRDDLKRSGSDSDSSIERRFVAMLNAPKEDLDDHLRHAVGLLKANDVAVDWTQLLNDLRGWDNDSRWKQRDWSRAFWQNTEADGATPAPAANE